jgi:uncharacterized repeat protein (TIGR03809 family)
MANRTDVARGREIVARWLALAEARLEHLTELFETGRWRRYHSEVSFLENIREAKRAVETWGELLRREASLDNSPIDISWLGRGHVTPLPRSALQHDPEKWVPVFRKDHAQTKKLERDDDSKQSHPALGLQSQTIRLPVDVPVQAAPAIAAIESAALDQASDAEEVQSLETPPPVLDIAAMQARYPLLRNSF